MSVQTVTTEVVQSEVSVDVDAFLAQVFPSPKVPNYGGLRYSAAWWANRRAQHGDI